MSNLQAGDRSLLVPFTVATGSVDGTTCTSVRLRIVRPVGGDVDKTLVPSATTLTSVTVQWELEADGSSLPSPGEYRYALWLYAGASYLGHTLERTFTVDPRRVAWPT